MIICGGNRVEWFVADYAAIFKSIVTIPVHVAFDDAAIKQILQETDGPLPIAPATQSPFLAVLAYMRECAMVRACHAFCASTAAKMVVCEAKYVHRFLELGKECSALEVVIQMDPSPIDTHLLV